MTGEQWFLIIWAIFCVTCFVVMVVGSIGNGIRERRKVKAEVRDMNDFIADLGYDISIKAKTRAQLWSEHRRLMNMFKRCDEAWNAKMGTD